MSWGSLKALFSRSIPTPAPDRQIDLTDTGFEIRAVGAETAETALQWDEIARIRTYKVDLHTTDCICLLFEQAAGLPVPVSEEWDGFIAFMERMRERFPTIPADWYETVMLPAFETNEAILFEKR